MYAHHQHHQRASVLEPLTPSVVGVFGSLRR